MGNFFSRLFLALLWLLHWLPLPWQACLGRGLGGLLYRLVGRRRRVVLTNLRLCFPDLSEAERETLAREHFALLTRSFLERGLAWWASAARLRRLITIEGLEHIKPADSRLAEHPIILLVPHFVGLDIGGTRLCLEMDMLTVYSPQKPPVIDAILRHGRSRFGEQLLLTRYEGIRPTVKAIRSKRPFYYLPDMDYGARDAVFVPFFGTPAATITGLSRLSSLTGAQVHECICDMKTDGSGYVLRIGAAWADFPSADIEADTRRMNAAIEAQIRSKPAQYYWVHKRFKTRPEGEKSLY